MLRQEDSERRHEARRVLLQGWIGRFRGGWTLRAQRCAGTGGGAAAAAVRRRRGSREGVLEAGEGDWKDRMMGST